MKQARKFARKAVLAVLALAALLYTVPLLTAFYLCTGLIDVLRNTRRDAMVFERYFLGNGIPTWLLSPFNLLIDLFSYRNPGIYRLEDLPPAWRSEVETVLDTFKARKAEIIGDVDRVFEAGRRGMYVFKWYGKENATASVSSSGRSPMCAPSPSPCSRGARRRRSITGRSG